MKKLRAEWTHGMPATTRPTTFSLPFCSMKTTRLNMQNCNFAFFIWLWKLVCHINSGTLADGNKAWGSEEVIWALEVGSSRRQENLCCEESWYVLITKYYSDKKIEGNKMGGTRGTYGREEKSAQPFDRDLKGGSYFLDLAVDGR